MIYQITYKQEINNIELITNCYSLLETERVRLNKRYLKISGSNMPCSLKKSNLNAIYCSLLEQEIKLRNISRLLGFKLIRSIISSILDHLESIPEYKLIVRNHNLKVEKMIDCLLINSNIRRDYSIEPYVTGSKKRNKANTWDKVLNLINYSISLILS